MDYNDLALFVRTVESESFTAAALAAGVQRSSVTRCITRIETELGVRLFQRTSHHRAITDAGRALYARVRPSFASIDDATDAIRDQGGEPSGVVRLTIPPGMSMGGVPEVIALFSRKHPRIRVEVMIATRRLDLVREGIDIALRAGALEDSSLIARRLGTARSGLFAAPEYLKARGAPKTPSDLTAHDCIVFRGPERADVWTLIGRGGPPEKVTVNGPVGADDMAFIVNLVKAGNGICWLPLLFANRDVEGGALKRVLPDYHLVGPTFHIVLPSSSFVPSRVALLRDFLVAQLVPALDNAPTPHVARKAKGRGRAG